MKFSSSRSARALLLCGASFTGVLSANFAQAADKSAADGLNIAPIVIAQTQTAQTDQPPGGLEEVVVTGTRIHTTDTTVATPVTIINAQSITDQGFTDAGAALNEMTTMIPSLPTSSGSTPPSNYGQQYPNLFNLGSNRTLTLMNGMRMPSTTPGLGAEATDEQIFPVGLLDRIDVVQGGGASVYGSGAIAGVVNYVMKDHFNGVTFDALGSISTYGDYPLESFRLTAGTDIFGGKGNIAGELDYSHKGSLTQLDRPLTSMNSTTIANPAYTGNLQGNIPSTIEVFNAHNYTATPTGLISTVTGTAIASPAQLLQVNGSAVQFNAAGSLINYNPGTQLPGASFFAQGGDGIGFDQLGTLDDGLDRYVFNGIGHYDISDHLKLSGEVMAVRENTYDPDSRLTLLSETVPFYKTNPYLNSSVLSSLEAASPSFNAGNPLYLLLYPFNVLPANSATSELEVYRGRVGLDGDFNLGTHNFYYTVSVAHAQVNEWSEAWSLSVPNFNNATNAVTNSSGQIVCAANLTTTTAPGCVPYNIFGDPKPSQAVRNYVTAISGNELFGSDGNVTNKFDDINAIIGGDLINLPAGALKFSGTYEHRAESFALVPFEADALGFFSATGTGSPSAYGAYHTNEYAGELLMPVLGKNFSLPFVESFELHGSVREVDHSIAGKETVWGADFQWQVVDGVKFRGSLSRNFNAPTLAQLLTPQTTAANGIVIDPCHITSITGGSFPALRAANCLALFTANPAYGLDQLPAGTANTPAARLASFKDPSNNNFSVNITSGGNPTLVSETSHTETFGVVLQPTFVPGLTVTADRVIISLRNGITSFSGSTFLSLCLDSSSYPNAFCNQTTRNANGTLATANSFFFNAGYNRVDVETYNVDYRTPLNRIFGGSDKGTIDFNAQVTHNTGDWSVNGFTVSETDNTTALPQWSANFGLSWSDGPWRVSSLTLFRPAEKQGYTATVATSVDGIVYVNANVRENINASYTWGRYTFGAGINNLFNQAPSFPTFNYGDLIGRQFFGRVNVKF